MATGPTQQQAASYRSRLLAGFEAAIAENGYAASTIGDIVRHARVSKRTFYEQFAGKEDCFLASYAAATDRMLQAIAEAFDDRLPWRGQVDAAIKVYLFQLQAKPALTRTYALEIPAAGPRALRLRRAVFDRFNLALLELVARLRRRHPELRELSPAMATAVVGGINALVLVAAETGRIGRVLELEATASDLLCTLLSAASPA